MFGVERSSSATLYFLAVCGSLLLSLLMIYQQGVINPDGVCYLQSAATFPVGLSAATHLCGQAQWPFYSLLIFSVGQLVHGSYLTAAYGLDSFFSLLSVLTFVAIIRLLTPNLRIAYLGLLVILLAHSFNHHRAEILRDHGYWAFYLMSVYSLLRFFSQQHFHFALLWSAALGIATLFRVEGILFLFFLPFAIFLERRITWALRIRAFAKLNFLTCFMFVIAFSWMYLHPEFNGGRLNEIFDQLTHSLMLWVAHFNATADALGQYVLNAYSLHDARFILMLMLVGWYLFYVVSNLSGIYTLLLLYAWKKHCTTWIPSAYRVLGSYILLNGLMTFFFLNDYMFLADRYLVALSLVLMLWVPFALEDLLQAWPKRRWLVIVSFLLVFICGISSWIEWGYSKTYLRAAGEWLATHAPPQAKIYSNDYMVLYYSNHFGSTLFTLGPAYENLNKIAAEQWRQYDYLALRINKKMAKQNLPMMEGTPIATFYNRRGDHVWIYKVSMEKKQ